MFEPNVSRVLDQIGPQDVVLDIGGWACPFNRANYVLDSEPYETRGYYATIGVTASQGGDKEFFTHDTWIRRDICEHTPFPFADQSIDFVICSHVLEDIRDPLWVCSEMNRIAKRGYIEFPSRLVESCRGWESERIAGLTHHRWLITVDEKARSIEFFMKHHMIHAERRFSFPPRFFGKLSEAQRITGFLWEKQFLYHEKFVHGLGNVAQELSDFVEARYRYPAWLLAWDRATARCGALSRRVERRLSRLLSRN